MIKNLTFLAFLFLLFQNVNSQQLINQVVDNKSGNRSEAYQSFTSDGAWTWYNDPRAVYYQGKHKRTYAGWIDSNGSIHIAFYDHNSGKTEDKVIYKNLEIDDHNNPSILFDETGRLMVFFCKHAKNDPINLVKSTNPEDISKWGTVKSLALNDTIKYPNLRNSYTYTHPIKLSSEKGRIYLFWRGIDGKPSYSVSDNNGETWTMGAIYIMPDQIYTFRRPYVKIYSNGIDKIHFAFTDGHPRDEKENSIYYMYLKNNIFYKSDNQKIATINQLPLIPRMAEVIYDASISKIKAWIWDVAEDKNGKPVIAFAKFPNDSNHIYCYSKIEKDKWITVDLINSGGWFPKTLKNTSESEPNYSGGLCIDHENSDVLYLSVKRDTIFELEKWTNNNSENWSIERITKESTKDNVRPFAVRGAEEGNPLQVLWMQNTKYIHYGVKKDFIQANPEFTNYKPYQTSIKTSLLSPMKKWDR